MKLPEEPYRDGYMELGGGKKRNQHKSFTYTSFEVKI